MAQADLYRLPRNPGYPGSYQWRPTVAALLLFGLVNGLATQHIAAAFHYQPALGPALFHFRHILVYQPFAWVMWCYHNILNHDPAIHKPLTEAMMIAFASLPIMAISYMVFSGVRSRRLSRGAEDLKGTARFANAADVKRTGLLDGDGGVYVGGWKRNERSTELHYLRHNGPEHVFAFAPTRSGKGISLVIPTLLAWPDSAVIYDIKGENWQKSAGYRASTGQLCYKFAPAEASGSCRFNPLAEIRLGTELEVRDAQNIAEMLIRTGENKASEHEYFLAAGVSIMVGMILHVCYAAAVEGRTACLADLCHIFSRPGHDFRETLQELLNFEHDPGGQYGWTLANGKPTITHPVVSLKMQEMLNKDDSAGFGGVVSTATTALTIYADPVVARNTSSSDFAINDLVNHEKPVSLYIVIPPSDLDRLRPLTRLIFTLICNRLTSRMDYEDKGVQLKNKHRLLLLIDEFPSLKRMEIFSRVLSYMAGYGIKAYLIAQDIRQLVDAYGEHESIVSNCGIQIAFAPNQMDTAKLLSSMAGVRTIQKASQSFSGKRYAPTPSDMSVNTETIERPLMTPDEVLRLPGAVKVKTSDGEERIVGPGKMLIFVNGHFPILGTQMLYFADSVLLERSQIAPPAQEERPTQSEPCEIEEWDEVN